MLQNSPEIPGMLHKSQGILHDVSAWGSGARLGCSRNPRAFSMSWVLSCFSRVGGAADPDGPRETFHRGFPPPGRAGKVHGDLQSTQGEGFWECSRLIPQLGIPLSLLAPAIPAGKNRDQLPSVSTEMGPHLGKFPKDLWLLHPWKCPRSLGSILGSWEVSLPTGPDGL